jgi:NhaC family Na+:H+ antiporter
VVATCIGANIVTSDQYIAVAIPARLFRPEFLKRGLAPVLLSRVVGDSATVTSPLIPWNSCGAYMAAALGVPTTGFALYCFFNFLNPVITILFAVFGIRVLRTAAESAKAPAV